MIINNFRGKYSFLSNFYTTKIRYKGVEYSNTEAAFQAQKCPERAAEFASLTGRDAKRYGKFVPLRSDWEQVKVDIMYDIVLAKFIQNEQLKQQLLDTGECKLIESNTWGDTFWGVCNGVGDNKLGRILMTVRSYIETEPLR